MKLMSERPSQAAELLHKVNDVVLKELEMRP